MRIIACGNKELENSNLSYFVCDKTTDFFSFLLSFFKEMLPNNEGAQRDTECRKNDDLKEIYNSVISFESSGTQVDAVYGKETVTIIVRYTDQNVREKVAKIVQKYII